MFSAFAITLQDYADVATAITGWPMTQEELRVIAEKAWNLTRLYNVRGGFGRRNDTLPERLFSEVSSKGSNDRPGNG